MAVPTLAATGPATNTILGPTSWPATISITAPSGVTSAAGEVLVAIIQGDPIVLTSGVLASVSLQASSNNQSGWTDVAYGVHGGNVADLKWRAGDASDSGRTFTFTFTPSFAGPYNDRWWFTGVILRITNAQSSGSFGPNDENGYAYVYSNNGSSSNTPPYPGGTTYVTDFDVTLGQFAVPVKNQLLIAAMNIWPNNPGAVSVVTPSGGGWTEAMKLNSPALSSPFHFVNQHVIYAKSIGDSATGRTQLSSSTYSNAGDIGGYLMAFTMKEYPSTTVYCRTDTSPLSNMTTSDQELIAPTGLPGGTTEMTFLMSHFSGSGSGSSASSTWTIHWIGPGSTATYHTPPSSGVNVRAFPPTAATGYSLSVRGDGTSTDKVQATVKIVCSGITASAARSYGMVIG